MRHLLIFGATIGIVAACGGSDDDPPTTVTTAAVTTAAVTTAAVTTGASATTVAPTTTAAPTTSAVPTSAALTATAAPTTVAVGQPSDAEFEQILEALYDRNDELFEDPANADVQTVCALGADCETTTETVVRNLIAEGQHIIDTPPNDIATIEHVRDLSADPAAGLRPDSYYEVTYTLSYDSDVIGLIVDSDGEVVYEMVPPDDLTETRIVVRNLTDKELPWRFVD